MENGGKKTLPISWALNRKFIICVWIFVIKYLIEVLIVTISYNLDFTELFLTQLTAGLFN